LGVVAEAATAKAVAEYKRTDGTAALHIDQTTKVSHSTTTECINTFSFLYPQYGVSLHGATLSLPSGDYSLGVMATATKSAHDQLEANRLMRAAVVEAGQKVLGLGEKAVDPLASVSVVVADGGSTEASMTRQLQAEKKKMAKDNNEEITKIIRLPCHKHKLSLITKKALTKIVAETGLDDPFQLEMKTAKAFKATSTWGHSKGLTFDEWCGKPKGQSEMKGIKPPKHTRHHLRMRSMAHLLLAAPKLVKFIENVTAKARRGKGEARGDQEPSTINRHGDLTVIIAHA
jgi:hypothetical protein